MNKEVAQQPSQKPEEATQPAQPETAKDYFGYDAELFEEVAEKAVEAPEEKRTVGEIQEEVNRYLKEIKVDENGKFIYPEDIDPAIKVAISATKAARDNQSAFSKKEAELKALQAELKALREQVAQSVAPTSHLSQEEQQQLEELKYKDPEAWYRRMRELESTAQQKIDEKLKEVEKKAKEETEVEYRMRRLNEFNQGRETPVTPEMLELMVPPIYAKQLLEGEIDFDTYLEKAVAFIEGPKTVAKAEEPPKTKDLSKVTGSPEPVKESQDTGIDYANVVF